MDIGSVAWKVPDVGKLEFIKSWLVCGSIVNYEYGFHVYVIILQIFVDCWTKHQVCPFNKHHGDSCDWVCS